MAFFGRRRMQAGASIPLPLPPSGSALGKPEDAIPPHERQAVRAGGMFGRKRLPRTLQVIGATMRQMSGQAPGAIAEFTDAEAAAAERQRAEDMLFQRQKQDRGWDLEDAEREQRIGDARFGSEMDYRNRQLEQDQAQFEASLALQRRGQDLSARRSSRDNLSAQETNRISGAAEGAAQARTVRGLTQEFLQLNQRVPTGQLSAIRPDQWLNSDRERMRQITDQLTPMMRQPGTGAMSDGDRQMFANAVPRVGVMGSANQRAGDAMIQGARNMEDYAAFLDMYSEGGDLRGAEQNWNIYLNANPIYDRYGNVRSDRPSFEDWLAAGQPDMSQETSENSLARTLTDEQLMQVLGQQGQGQPQNRVSPSNRMRTLNNGNLR